jgi:hypothetical protein
VTKLLILGILAMTCVFIWDACALGWNPTMAALKGCASAGWLRMF